MSFDITQMRLKGYLTPLSLLGVIRTREVLTKDSPKIYIFRVQYRDCGVLRVETVTAVVNIKVIENSCEPRWKGLPQSVYYSLAEPQPKRLLWPQSYTLEMCGMTCEDSPRIVTQVSLNHGRPDMTLYPANPAFCRHDPRSLYEQRKLCGKPLLFRLLQLFHLFASPSEFRKSFKSGFTAILLWKFMPDLIAVCNCGVSSNIQWE
ncbi:unnamed protein product [Mesocestoides corti]|uniref:Uncharacterized protein n=1 Tax=Mesocestoides corti TaxID=53468 RepID=A0A0R3U6X7_MESCO|nr:unnamed protein product [Mesocestoides corti]